MISMVMPELIILLIIVVLVLGPEQVGRGIRNLREALRRKDQVTGRQESAKDKENKSN